MIKASVFSALLGLAASAAAQHVINADSSKLQATIRRDDAGFSDCGIRGVVQVVMPKESEVYDFSLNLTADSVLGLIKAGKYLVPGNSRNGWDIEKRKLMPSAPVAYWFAQQAADLRLKPFKYAKAEDAGFTLGLAEFSPTAEVISAMLAGEKVQFALRYPGDKVDRVISFSPVLDKADAETFLACSAGIERRMRRAFDDLDQKKK